MQILSAVNTAKTAVNKTLLIEECFLNLKISPATVERYLAELNRAGQVYLEDDLVWSKRLFQQQRQIQSDFRKAKEQNAEAAEAAADLKRKYGDGSNE